MKIISFNINSVRARLHQVQAIIDIHQPDLIGLQETKVHDDEYPHSDIEKMGYQSYIHGQKGHYGVAILSKRKLLTKGRGFRNDTEESQKRFVWCEIKSNKKSLFVLNGYFPQGEERNHPIKFPAKQKFYRDLLDHLKQNHLPQDHLIVMGDLNISPQDIDIGIGEKNKQRWLRTGKCSFLPEERRVAFQADLLGIRRHFQNNAPTSK